MIAVGLQYRPRPGRPAEIIVSLPGSSRVSSLFFVRRPAVGKKNLPPADNWGKVKLQLRRCIFNVHAQASLAAGL
jgi:hypothetical protein